MSNRYATWIRIGGNLKRRQAPRLITAIRADCARLNWGEPPFEPANADELRAACSADRLTLYDEEARSGEFRTVEATCRALGLSYERHTEAACGEDGVRVDWRPGMRTPFARPASNEGAAEALIPETHVRAALTLLETGHAAEGIAALRKLCPEVPEVPPLSLT